MGYQSYGNYDKNINKKNRRGYKYRKITKR